jgi:hypothetical protein
MFNRFSEHLNKPTSRLQRLQPLKYWLSVGIPAAVYVSGNIFQLRGELPDAVDVFNHSGNTLDTVGVGILAGGLAASAGIKWFENPTIGKVKAAGLAGALAAGAVVNLAVETRFGVSLSHWQNTLDTTDLLYGVAGGVAAAAVNVVPLENSEMIPNIQALPRYECEEEA